MLAGGVLVGAVNIYLASSLLPTAVADIGGAGFYAWNMTIYLVAMVIATMLVSRLLARWGNVGAYRLGFAVFLAGSLACAASPAMPVLLAGRGVQGFGAGVLSGLGFAVIRSALPRRLWTRGNALMSAMYGVGNFVGPALRRPVRPVRLVASGVRGDGGDRGGVLRGRAPGAAARRTK
ncbi:MFS transporter [Microtetraspora sp. NBRC 13810]|uniref:MFS transporter n=1 Tax=Microtetraspora sp. NBRC 13810 TaxID=3030990 RepID=UPI0025544878|nr:MFS transporter [Microtetraspora sp. NBRC 13810]